MQSDEERAQEALYGQHTRSGTVNLTPLYADEDGRMLDGYWCGWDWIEIFRGSDIFSVQV